MDPLSQLLHDRRAEINAYLDLLDAVEAQVRMGPPRLEGTGTTISPQQVKILYAGVYLLLYNLVEAVVTRCIDSVSIAASGGAQWQPGDLSAEMRREWVRYVADTHREQAYDSRLEKAIGMCEHLIQQLPVTRLWIYKGGGGNWDRSAITDLSSRIGVQLRIDAVVDIKVKRHFREEKAPLEFVKKLRNDLAHGSVSFVESGDGVTAGELRDLANCTADYMTGVVASFRSFIDGYEFLRPEVRPEGAPI